MPITEWEELACGNCGVAEHRLQAGRDAGRVVDIRVICRGCGCVSHVVAPVVQRTVEIEWGREAEGEQAPGRLTAMRWRT